MNKNIFADRRCGFCRLPLAPDGMFCGNCGRAVSATSPPVAEVMTEARRTLRGGDGTAGESVRSSVMVRDVFRSQVAVGDGNVQIRVDVDGSTQFGHVQGGVALQARDVPVLTPRARRDLVGRDALIEQVSWDLYRQTSVQLFGTSGVGRTAVAEAVLRRLAAVRGVELRPQNQPHTLESLYRRLVHVFFGEIWYQPEEAVLRLEVARADLHALIVITDCDLDHEDLRRLLGSFPRCTFLLTSRRQTLSEDAGAAYEVDPLTPGQARELVIKELGTDLAGLQNLQWIEAYRLAGGQVQRLIEHVAFIKRAARRPGYTDLQPVPLKEQVAILVAGLSEPARQVLIAMATFGTTLTPALFGAVTGLPVAARAAGELVAAGLIKEEGDAFGITLDAALAVADGGERTDPQVAADGLMPLLEAPDPPDPHLLLAVARALRDAGHDAYTSWLTRAAAPLALAAGEVEVWIRLVALGAQAASKSRRKLDLEFFLNEQHTSSLLRGDTIAAAAALATLGELLSNQHASAPAAARPARQGRQGRRLIRQGRRALSVRHGVVGAAAIVAAATVLVVATRPGPPTPQLAGTWTDGAGDTYHFAAGASNTYTASQVWGGSLRCYHANDTTVTGNDGHYKGSIKVYPAQESSCQASIGSATITIVVAANGASARVTTAGSDCGDCTTRTWTRASASTSPSQMAAAG
jgi:hypothetical protein